MMADSPPSAPTGAPAALIQAEQPRSPVFRRCREDGPTAAATVFIAVATGLFLLLAIQFLEGDLGLARALLFGLPEPFNPAAPIGPGWLADMARDVSALGSVEVLAALTAAVLGYLIIAGRIGPTLFIVMSMGAGTLVGYVLKLFFERLRPHHLIEQGDSIINTSFPSGHAMLAALFYLTIGTLVAHAEVRRWLRFYVLVVAACVPALVGVSRVYLGVHWPTDVVAGWAVGAGWVTVCWLAWPRGAAMVLPWSSRLS